MSQVAQKPNQASRSVTVTDLARAAGVSRSTVSLVLRSSPLVKRETGRRVEEAIERLGYVYNRNAANLRRRTSDMVAMVINDLTNPFFAELAVGLDEALQAAGYVSLMANTSEDPARQRRVMESMREHGAAGYILCPAMGTGARQAAALANWSAPIIQVMRRLPGARLGTVVPDNALGARMATERLLCLGHRRIAFLGGSEDNVVTAERASGYRAALDGAGTAVDPALVVPAALNRGGGVDALRRVLALEHPPTAALCFSDVVAFGVLDALPRPVGWWVATSASSDSTTLPAPATPCPRSRASQCIRASWGGVRPKRCCGASRIPTSSRRRRSRRPRWSCAVPALRRREELRNHDRHSRLGPRRREHHRVRVDDRRNPRPG